MDVLGLIPARGGSKGVEGKNMRLLAGKPLLSHAFEAAKKSGRLTRTIVTTDSDRIRDYALGEGVDAPFKRPGELADDKASCDAVVEHALEALEAMDYLPDIIVLLQPTSPLRTGGDIDAAIDLYTTSECGSVISVLESNRHLLNHFTINEEGSLDYYFGGEFRPVRRQDRVKTYIPNGAVYVTGRKDFLEHKTFYQDKIKPYIMPYERSIDVDEQHDLEYARYLLKK